ncbi:solute:sodium symporter family transporter [Victivallis lenta]|uniref:solute:sodium symporter family transporter n=1 Tax=Victivallis lenta TaxID=2606640 RepID=UPI000D04201C|nr:solute:sodium symporter family transporter [Victivallis lenta]AVM45585.1 solute:sodium symporter family transporter [Victivallales bacterium CCUG 44730]MBS1453416.1 solute:sodium symporter family transporter [Lentisphaeria bacterium]HBP06725.1 solute:sodium symporter family transporter [Lentisphaeria bacterium]HCH86471.1 solute:sodium symporter family transporter [Lentisphaeria bacterium]
MPAIWFTLISFLFFTGLVALLTWLATRGEDLKTQKGYFLAGRSLTFPVIAGSLLLTNLSTEQMVGLNGDAFSAGLSVMVWEVVAVVALVAMALFFLPRFLKSGITTVPQLLEIRFDRTTQIICNLIFLIAYMTILLPIILYTGAQGMASILNLTELTGIQNHTVLLWLSVWVIGLIGSAYALLGGLRSTAFSDMLNGIGLLAGGFLITILGLKLIGGDAGILGGLETLSTEIPDRLNSIGGAKAPVPFWNIFTGVLIINVFYWCTNQQIIQRTLAASNLAEGQKGVLLTGLLKLLGPLYLVLPGIMAYYIFVVQRGEELKSVLAYGTLVREVLPWWLTGFFAAVLVGAILSSFNSALNSTCTLFSLGIYKRLWKKDATEIQVVRSGKYFGCLIAAMSMIVAPLLAGQDSIFTYLQTMNGIYNIPICAVVLVGLLSKRTPAIAAKIALLGGVIIIALGVLAFPEAVNYLFGGQWHFFGVVFVLLIAVMLFFAYAFPRPTPWVHEDSGEVDLTPWKYVVPCGIALLVVVVLIYAFFADFSVLSQSTEVVATPASAEAVVPFE